MAVALKSIYQLKIQLKGAKPPIWRRVLVPNNIRLDKLQDIEPPFREAFAFG